MPVDRPKLNVLTPADIVIEQVEIPLLNGGALLGLGLDRTFDVLFVVLL